MISREEIENIINAQIKSIEKIGDQGSSSGHMSYVSFQLNDFNYSNIDSGNIKVKYSYTKYIETEFTYYPDNPPLEYHYSRLLIIDKSKNIISDKPYNKE